MSSPDEPNLFEPPSDEPNPFAPPSDGPGSPEPTFPGLGRGPTWSTGPAPVYPHVLAQCGPASSPHAAYPGVAGPSDGPGLGVGQYPPVRRRRPWFVPLLVGLSVAVVGSIAAFGGLVVAAVGLGSSDDIVSTTSFGSDEGTYSITDRPGWDSLVAHGQELSDTYLAKVDDGTIFEIVPRTQEGVDYVHDFLLLLADENAALTFTTATSDDPAELDAQIEETRDRFDELERTFLAGEDFGVDISITNEDGSTYTSDGDNHWDDTP